MITALVLEMLGNQEPTIFVVTGLQDLILVRLGYMLSNYFKSKTIVPTKNS